MKKLSALVLALLMVFSLAACSGGEVSPTAPVATTEDPNLIDWQDIPDPDIVGAWRDTDAKSDEVILFTPESDVRLVLGSVTMEADIKYGVDGNGIKSAYTSGSVLYGQWTYVVKDGVLTVTYPEEGKVFTYNAVKDYTPVTLIADENAYIDDALVGKWANEEFMDSYTFTEDGYAKYEIAFDDGIYAYDSEILYTFSTNYGDITLTHIADNTDKKEVSNTFEYSVDGDKLIIDGNEYTLVD